MATKKKKEKEDAGSADDLMTMFNKRYGKNVFQRASDMVLHRVPCGTPGLDWIMGKGIVRGRTYLFIGNPSTGKSTNAFIIGGQMQKHCRFCSSLITRKKCCEKKTPMKVLVVDVELTYNPEWAEANGMDLDLTYVVQPPGGEAAVDVVKEAIRSGDFDLIIFDSIAQTTPQDEINKDAENMVVGRHAMLINKAMRVWTSSIAYCQGQHGHQPTIITINQWRQVISFTGGRTMYGGQGQKYASSCTLIFKRADYIKEKGNIVGSKVIVKADKNKLTGHIREVAYDMYLEDKMEELQLKTCIDHYSQLGNMAKEAGIIVGSAWLLVPGLEKKLSGMTNVAKYLRENDKAYEDVRVMVKRVWDGEDADLVLDEYEEKNKDGKD